MSKTDRELPEYVVRIQGIRSSGASGKHLDRRTRRIRSRGDAKRFAIAEARA